MSTKIYNGLRLKPMNLMELREFADRLREKIRPIHEDLFHQFIADQATTIIDIITLFPDNFAERISHKYGKSGGMNHPLFIAGYYLKDRQKKIKDTQERDPVVDFECKLVVIPINGKKLLAIPFIEQPKFLEVILSADEVSEYGYWNNPDEPENVTQIEWEQRKKDWDKALPGVGIPYENGFSLDLTNNYRIIPSIEETVNKVSTVECRAESWGKRFILNQLMEEAKVKQGDPFDNYWTCTDELKTEENQAKIKSETERLKGILKEINKETIEEAYQILKGRVKTADGQPHD